MTQSLIPVIHSIPDGAALITTILCDYAILQPHSCKLYKRGLNDTYLVEAEAQKYILRVYQRGWRINNSKFKIQNSNILDISDGDLNPD